MKPLKKGDIVDVIAPASACSMKELRHGIKALRALGLQPRVPRKLFAKSVLFSNTDEKRLDHLKKALYAGDSKFIWCVRGGYGSLRLMPQVDKWKRPGSAKIFLGYSDITTLHIHLNQKWKWPTLHGPLLDRLGSGNLTPAEHRELIGVLFGKRKELKFTGLKPLNKKARKKGVIRAPVVGGNLAVLVSGLGTPSGLKPSKSILFLEDTYEYPHRVDRMLEQARQAGLFKECKAVVFGHFQLSDAVARRKIWNDVIARFAKSANVPVIAGLPVGHDKKRQRTLPFNTMATLSLGSRPSLTVQTGILPA